ALRRQRAGSRIGHVAQVSGGLFDPLGQFRRHAAFAAQRPGRRDRADPGLAGDILQGDAPTGASASFWGGQGLILTISVSRWRRIALPVDSGKLGTDGILSRCSGFIDPRSPHFFDCFG
ncbi:hypothetical protein RZS08_30675, partial [Arthrospira platensis SPKY1]|nr:hypothetical protein [Arthrospira platensis SPKY1]